MRICSEGACAIAALAEAIAIAATVVIIVRWIMWAALSKSTLKGSMQARDRGNSVNRTAVRYSRAIRMTMLRRSIFADINSNGHCFRREIHSAAEMKSFAAARGGSKILRALFYL